MTFLAVCLGIASVLATSPQGIVAALFVVVLPGGRMARGVIVLAATASILIFLGVPTRHGFAVTATIAIYLSIWYSFLSAIGWFARGALGVQR